MPRVPGQPTPCYRCPKIPAGVKPVPWQAVEWSEKNWHAYRFHQRCKAVGRFPADAIVVKNAGLIEATLQEMRDQWQQANVGLLSSYLGMLTFKA